MDELIDALGHARAAEIACADRRVSVKVMFSGRARELMPLRSGSPDGGSESPGGYFRVNLIRLYQPDPVLAARIRFDELSACLEVVTSVATEYFGGLGCEFGSQGVLIGIRPGGRQVWCEQVEGHLPPGVWDVFVKLLEETGENIRPTVTQPVAFAIECALGEGPSGHFPIGPTAWQQAATGHDGPLEIPDGIFEIVFPD